MSWERKDEKVWRRIDGAEVRMTDANSRGGDRLWVGYGPELSCQMRRRMRCDRPERFTPLRKFATAHAAMRAVDAEFPLQGSLL